VRHPLVQADAPAPPLGEVLEGDRPGLEHFGGRSGRLLRWSWVTHGVVWGGLESNSVSTLVIRPVACGDRPPQWPVALRAAAPLPWNPNHVACACSSPWAPPFDVHGCEVLLPDRLCGLRGCMAGWWVAVTSFDSAQLEPWIRQLAQLAVKHFVPPCWPRCLPWAEAQPAQVSVRTWPCVHGTIDAGGEARAMGIATAAFTAQPAHRRFLWPAGPPRGIVTAAVARPVPPCGSMEAGVPGAGQLQGPWVFPD